MENKPDQRLKKLGLIWIVLGEVVGYTLGGLALGYLAWSKFHLSDWILILCPMVGLGLAFYQLYKLTQKER
jgi:hypothetical protein